MSADQPAPLHPDVRRLLDEHLPPRLPPYSVDALRAGHTALTGLLGGEPVAVAAVDDIVVAPDARWQSAAVPVRRIVPTQGGGAPAAAIVWLHGGGWATGSLDGFETFGRALAQASGCHVFLVDYRLAPEAPYPAGLADSVAAFDQIRRTASSLGIDPEQLAIGGDSAGAHLAVGTTRWLRRAGLPAPSAQLLLYPVADARMQSVSYRRYADGFYLSAAQMAWFWCQFVPDGLTVDGQRIPLDHPDLSPVFADDLAGMPPSLIVTAECDVLRDEGVALFAALRRAGVDATHHEVPGMIHGFIRMLAVLRQAGETVDTMAAFLAGQTGRQRTP